MKTEIKKKPIIIGALIILGAALILSCFCRLSARGKVINGCITTCHCIELNPDGSYGDKHLIIDCTIRFNTWYGKTCTFECHRDADVPYEQCGRYLVHTGDYVTVLYNPLFPESAQIAGLP